MKSNPALKAIMLTALLALAGPGRLAGQTESKDIIVGPGEAQEKIFCIGGNVVVEGTVLMDVVVIGGHITVSGEVKGSVVGFGSDIRIGSKAVIGKDMAALGGRLEKEPGCVIRGETIYIQTARLGDEFLRKGPLSNLARLKFSPFFMFIKLARIFLWLIAAVLAAALMPRQIEHASSAIRTSFWPVFWTGCLGIVMFSALVLLAALLSIILIGIPILIAAGAVGMIIKLFGQMAVFHALGLAILNTAGKKNAGILAVMLTGLAVVGVAGFIPIFSMLVSLGTAIVAWGAAIRTRFGTMDNWFQGTGSVRAGAAAGR